MSHIFTFIIILGFFYCTDDTMIPFVGLNQIAGLMFSIHSHLPNPFLCASQGRLAPALICGELSYSFHYAPAKLSPLEGPETLVVRISYHSQMSCFQRRIPGDCTVASKQFQNFRVRALCIGVDAVKHRFLCLLSWAYSILLSCFS